MTVDNRDSDADEGVIPLFREPNTKEAESIQYMAISVVHAIAEQTRFPVNTVEGLEEAATRLGCHVALSDNVENSYKAMVGGSGAEGVICVNTSVPYLFVVRGLAHEVTHHVLLWRLVQPNVQHAPAIDSLREHCDAEEIICRAVEDVVMALPDGWTRNGKPSPPNNTYIRIYRRLNVDVPSQRMHPRQWGEPIRDLAEM